MADLVRCPSCGKAWPTLAALKIRGLGLALIATCPNCGHEWGVNHLWRKTQEQKPKAK